MSMLHAKLYSILPFVESDCPAESADDIQVQMTAPDETTLDERYAAEAKLINNVGLKLRMGVITKERAALELGYDEWADEEQFDTWIAPPQADPNSNDPNEVQQVRKGLDSLNAGKNRSNNSSGQKGD